MEGTYPLPEAQLDRFLFKLKVTYPTAEDLHLILDRTTQTGAPEIAKVIGADEVRTMRATVRDVPMTRDVQAHAIALVLATHPENAEASPLAKRFVRYGASPRGVQALILAAKIYALLDGRYHVSRQDISRAALPALRHRIIPELRGRGRRRDQRERAGRGPESQKLEGGRRKAEGGRRKAEGGRQKAEGRRMKDEG